MTWYVYGASAGDMDLTLILSRNIARFHFGGHETSQNVKY